MGLSREPTLPGDPPKSGASGVLFSKLKKKSHENLVKQAREAVSHVDPQILNRITNVIVSILRKFQRLGTVGHTNLPVAQLVNHPEYHLLMTTLFQHGHRDHLPKLADVLVSNPDVFSVAWAGGEPFLVCLRDPATSIPAATGASGGNKKTGPSAAAPPMSFSPNPFRQDHVRPSPNSSPNVAVGDGGRVPQELGPQLGQQHYHKSGLYELMQQGANQQLREGAGCAGAMINQQREATSTSVSKASSSKKSASPQDLVVQEGGAVAPPPRDFSALLDHHVVESTRTSDGGLISTSSRFDRPPSLDLQFKSVRDFLLKKYSENEGYGVWTSLKEILVHLRKNEKHSKMHFADLVSLIGKRNNCFEIQVKLNQYQTRSGAAPGRLGSAISASSAEEHTADEGALLRAGSSKVVSEVDEDLSMYGLEFCAPGSISAGPGQYQLWFGILSGVVATGMQICKGYVVNTLENVPRPYGFVSAPG